MDFFLTKYRDILDSLGNRARRDIFVLPFIIISLLVGCASTADTSKSTAEITAAQTKDPLIYLIQPGDQLDIKFFYNPELNEAVTVRPDGKISLQLINDVQAAGKDPAALGKTLSEMYMKELKAPRITVIVRSFSNQRVFVGGEVNNQGLVDFRPGMTPLQAVLHAGGFKETAKPEETIIIRKAADKRPYPIRVDLGAALYGNGPAKDFQLKTFDIVYVPKSGIAKADKFMEQYIEKLLLFKGWYVNLGYDIWHFWGEP